MRQTQDEDKQNTTYKTKKMRSTRPYNNPMVNVNVLTGNNGHKKQDEDKQNTTYKTKKDEKHETVQ